MKSIKNSFEAVGRAWVFKSIMQRATWELTKYYSREDIL
jgi:hypothetical protein